MGWHPDKFAEAYNANLAEASIEIAESDVVAPAIIALMEMVAAGKKPDSGEGHGEGDGSQRDRLLAALPVDEARSPGE